MCIFLLQSMAAENTAETVSASSYLPRWPPKRANDNALPLPTSKPCPFLCDNHTPCTISVGLRNKHLIYCGLNGCIGRGLSSSGAGSLVEVGLTIAVVLQATPPIKIGNTPHRRYKRQDLGAPIRLLCGQDLSAAWVWLVVSVCTRTPLIYKLYPLLN